MVPRILIANRGEVARRIIRTCSALGIESIAVYSASDAGAPYLSEATLSECLPPSGSHNPYINQEAILEIASRVNAAAIHPGYGFLSENADFAEEANKRGILFIGPSPETIRLLGDKASARMLAKKLAIPVLEAVSLEVQDNALAKQQCGEIGYPLMLKATGTGGGRAMRKVFSENEFSDAFSSVLSEARLFGARDEILAERLLTEARHIEVQLCGFQNGCVIHLGERDCSAQRRFQKLIEESPALGLNDSLRSSLFEAAVQLGSTAGLQSLATAEFLCTENEFFFLEVNPRLQVEHPVTEIVTGLDLVELQLRIVSDPVFSLSQEDIQCRSAACEVRIVAEAPEQHFAPSARHISFLRFPNNTRNEHALSVPARPNLAFDSLLAKLISQGDTVLEARAEMRKALGELAIVGPATTAPFLERALQRTLPYTTSYLEENHQALTERNEQVLRTFSLAAVYSVLYHGGRSALEFNNTELSDRPANNSRNQSSKDVWQELSCHGRYKPVFFPFIAESDSLSEDTPVYVIHHTHEPQHDATELSCTITQSEETLQFTTRVHTRTSTTPGASTFWEIQVSDDVSERSVLVVAEDAAARSAIAFIEGVSVRVRPFNPAQVGSSDSLGSARITSPLPGKITAIHTRSKETVTRGQLLFSIESMKMEHAIHAPRDAQVKQIYASVGQLVEKDALLADLEDSE